MQCKTGFNVDELSFPESKGSFNEINFDKKIIFIPIN